MKRILLAGFLALSIFSTATGQVQCDNDSTGLIPIQDLGADYYMDTWQGGLYIGGNNTPPTFHLNQGIKIVKKLRPLDTLGNISYENGKIVLAGFGASTVGGPFNHMISMSHDYTDLNPCFKAVNAANGSDGVETMTIDNVDYWDYIKVYKLGTKGLTPIQVQVAWLMHSSRTDSNGTDINTYVDSLVKRFTVALNAMTYYYPNLKVVYVSGFPYGGYADPLKVLYHVIHEPVSYHHNFAVKELIKNQMMGDPTLRYKDPGRQVPYLIWGPPLWADGMNPTEYDSLTWNCELEFAEDGGGYHLKDAGKDKLALMLLNFFRSDTLSEGWVMDGPKWDACPNVGREAEGPNDDMFSPVDGLSIYPNPSSGEFYADIPEVITGAVQVKVFNHLGEIVLTDNYESSEGYSAYRFNLEGQPSGIYYFSIVTGGKVITEPFIIQ